MTDASGSVTHRHDYDPFGVTTETTSTGAVADPWRYAGQYFNVTTGIYKMGARYCQPDLVRWTQPDPSERGPTPTPTWAPTRSTW